MDNLNLKEASKACYKKLKYFKISLEDFSEFYKEFEEEEEEEKQVLEKLKTDNSIPRFYPLEEEEAQPQFKPKSKK
jgi:hypothetical protein